MIKGLVFLITLNALAVAQMPVPELPRVYIDTTFNLPTGTTWNAHSATDFQNALNSSSPGDVIVLDAGVTYSGNFKLPAKSNPNHQWIYIVSSALANLPAPGTRVSPADAVNMPKIITPNGASAITSFPGTNYYRLAGLEVFSTSTRGCNVKHVPPINCSSDNLLLLDAAMGQTLPDSITIDRCYMHGSPTQDVQEAVFGNATNLAVVDSYISDIHLSLNDSQAILSMRTPGPIKIVNNFLSATTENIMIGGGGGPDNPYVPSDIEIRNNWLFKPLTWAQPGVTLPPYPQWAVKNNLEFKSGQRVLVDGNILENNWKSAQDGTAVLFTVRTSASGNKAVVDDITFTNNIVKNVTNGFTTLESDFLCGKPPYQQCTNPGESKRVSIANNLVLFRDPRSIGGSRNIGIYIASGLADYVLQHNTFVPAPGTDCFASTYFIVPSGTKWPPAKSMTHNMWILDNAFCRQPSGDFGGQGTVGLTSYMGDPAPVDPRYMGNVMYVPSNNKVQQWPLHNYATTVPFTYMDQTQGNYQLAIPNWTDTTDGKEAGVDNSQLLK